MKNNIGVWLDTEKAYIITLKNDESHVEIIESDVETRVRFKGETKAYSKMGNQFINPAKRMTHRRRHQFKQYFEEITDCLSEAEEIYLFGPAETKVHLAKHLSKDSNLKDRIRKIESEDQMTEKQMIACVKNIFKKDKVNVNVRIRH
ncbi:hypothetical protein GCQ56_17745 [Marinifilum sp. N1E240]|uniref:hypothetical protein n=1 Tax=Marinifilum sp. N1E240 TaxID=2608082 RepID=UPI00128AFE58|nr:hypothetical protein [Marinifilum sp. N1E240]MPQ48848.1 hypothetical protein [Marinifilum sp. N1E240]